MCNNEGVALGWANGKAFGPQSEYQKLLRRPFLRPTRPLPRLLRQTTMMMVISPSQTGFPMEAKLIVVAGKSAQKSIPLKLPTIIGRSHEAGVTVNHPMVSRQHAELFETDGLLMIRDLGSLNGTVVGDQRIKESPLPPDANFTVGPLTFKVQYVYNGDLGALPAPVLAEKPNADSQETEPSPKSPGELTDNKIAKTIVPKPIEKKPDKKKSDETVPANAKPAQKPAKESKESSGDPFDDMLNELL